MLQVPKGGGGTDGWQVTIEGRFALEQGPLPRASPPVDPSGRTIQILATSSRCPGSQADRWMVNG